MAHQLIPAAGGPVRLFVLISATTVLSSACVGRPAPAAPLVAADRPTATVFTDTALFRAQCREADGLASLTPIPRQCTPRDQRAEPVIFPVPSTPLERKQ